SEDAGTNLIQIKQGQENHARAVARPGAPKPPPGRQRLAKAGKGQQRPAKAGKGRQTMFWLFRMDVL
ncbi:MAG: hypothetical protein RRA35_09610, partial [Desulfomonilia bacterium]|nr:hypothetical protein [Desulfomonilia bacterium]